jgi:hypothetical protein
MTLTTWDVGTTIEDAGKNVGVVASHISGRVHAYDAAIADLEDLLVEIGGNVAEWREELSELEVVPPKDMELPQ